MQRLSYKLLPVLLIACLAWGLHATGYASAIIKSVTGHLDQLAGQTSYGSQLISPPLSSVERSRAMWEDESPVESQFDEERYEQLLSVHLEGGHLKTADMAFMIEASQQKYVADMKAKRAARQQEYEAMKSRREWRRHRRWRHRRHEEDAG